MNDSRSRRVEHLHLFEEICAGGGLPVTMQRRLILEALAGRTDHPTAEGIFDAVRVGHPEISRATTYRTLELLSDPGVVRKVCHPGSSVRYDPNVDRHHHLVCTSCGRMVDFEDPDLDRIPLPETGRRVFRIDDYTIQFRGVCGECRKAPAGRPAKRGNGERGIDPKSGVRSERRIKPWLEGNVSFDFGPGPSSRPA